MKFLLIWGVLAFLVSACFAGLTFAALEWITGAKEFILAPLFLLAASVALFVILMFWGCSRSRKRNLKNGGPFAPP